MAGAGDNYLSKYSGNGRRCLSTSIIFFFINETKKNYPVVPAKIGQYKMFQRYVLIDRPLRAKKILNVIISTYIKEIT